MGIELDTIALALIEVGTMNYIILCVDVPFLTGKPFRGIQLSATRVEVLDQVIDLKTDWLGDAMRSSTSPNVHGSTQFYEEAPIYE
jgi:hypothetical protein